MGRHRQTLVLAGALAAFAAAVAVQVARDRVYPRDEGEIERLLYVRSTEAMKRIALSYDALAADIYWIRTIQHYGGDRLRRTPLGPRKYELLYPLLDMTTSLDPYFTIAYRFGAIFLSEAYPGGPGEPDRAIALLRKGIAAQPEKWSYYYDAGFVHYFYTQDYAAAADWFRRAARQPNAPEWLEPLAAMMLTHAGDRAAARFLWQQMLQADEAWLRRAAEKRLAQLDTLDRIDQLEAQIRAAAPQAARYTWLDLIRRGVLPGIPVDTAGTPFDIDPVTGDITVSRSSPLFPMPAPRRPQ